MTVPYFGGWFLYNIQRRPKKRRGRNAAVHKVDFCCFFIRVGGIVFAALRLNDFSIDFCFNAKCYVTVSLIGKYVFAPNVGRIILNYFLISLQKEYLYIRVYENKLAWVRFHLFTYFGREKLAKTESFKAIVNVWLTNRFFLKSNIN